MACLQILAGSRKGTCLSAALSLTSLTLCLCLGSMSLPASTMPPPELTEPNTRDGLLDLRVSPAIIPPGGVCEVVAEIRGGKGLITPGNLIVQSGEAIKLSPKENTLYTLTVTQADEKTQSGHFLVRVADQFAASVQTGPRLAEKANSPLCLLREGAVYLADYATFQRYGTAKGDFELLPKPKNEKSVAAAFLPDGRLLEIGHRIPGVAYRNLFMTDMTGKTASACCQTLIRYQPAIASLPDGRVFLAGGMTPAPKKGYPSYYSNAEVFNPGNGETQYLKTHLHLARSNAKATPLPDGRVLITGGRSLGVTHNEAELFDPNTEEFRLTAPLSKQREGHSSTLLHDGRVLMMGGLTTTGNMDKVDLYDPTSEKMATGGYVLARVDHTATLLPDGRVLLAGGRTPDFGHEKEERHKGTSRGYGDVLSELEIYHPVTQTTVAAGYLKHPREGHSAVLLGDGSVLITGGTGADGQAILESEIIVPHMAKPESAPAITEHPEDREVREGQSAHFSVRAQGKGALHYQWFQNGQAIPGATTPDYQIRHVSAALKEGQFSVAVYNRAGSIQSRPARLKVQTKPLSAPEIQRFDANKLIVFNPEKGGECVHFDWTTQNACFAELSADPAIKIKPGETAMKIVQDTCATVTARNLAGETTRSSLMLYVAQFTAEPLNPSTGTSALKVQFPVGTGSITPGIGQVQSGQIIPVKPASTVNYVFTISRQGFRGESTQLTLNPSGRAKQEEFRSLALANGKVLLIGKKAKDPAEIYDPTTLTCTPTGKTLEQRCYATMTLLSNGKVLLAGGATRTAELYDPERGTFTPTGSMSEARWGHAAQRLKDGRVLITGGRDGSDTLSSCEIYDPATGTFTRGKDLDKACDGHRSFLLKDGRVMLLRSGYDAVMQFFDPISGEWESRPAPEGLAAFSKVLQLKDHKILFLGNSARTPLYYDPISNATTPAPLPKDDYVEGCVLQNGKVLLAGWSQARVRPALLLSPQSGKVKELPHIHLNEIYLHYQDNMLPLKDGKVFMGYYDGTTALFDTQLPALDEE